MRMEVIAKARYVRMSPRKVRLVIDVVRGMPVEKALAQLRFMKKDAAGPVQKVVASAAANAEHNFQLERSDLVISKITADGGPVLHRWRARAMGRAAPIKKRTTHITVVLTSRSGAKVAVKKPEAPAKSGKTAVKKTAKAAAKPSKGTKKAAPKAKKNA